MSGVELRAVNKTDNRKRHSLLQTGLIIWVHGNNSSRNA